MANVRDFGAVGDGVTDDSEAIQHAVRDGDGTIELPRGAYRITRPIVADTPECGRIAFTGAGGTAKLIMSGRGPALLLRGTHTTTADPTGFRPEEWVRERMPTVSQLEIEGDHPEADGIEITGVMQPTLTGVLLRHLRTGVRIHGRARNVLISHCHIYHNTGVGVHLDRVNLHQTIVTGSHISYCRLGGVRIDGGEIRNLQITGNDIEYNNNRSHGLDDVDDIPTAEIYVDVREGTVREGTISGNTLQATYSPNGANIRFLGKGGEENHKAGMWTITGNLIGSQENNIHLTSVRGITISGNYIYSGHVRNLLVEDSRDVVVGPNAIGHNPDYQQNELCTGLRFVNCVGLNVSGLYIQDALASRHTVPGAPAVVRDGLVELIRCRRVNMGGVQILEGAPYGLVAEDCSDVLVHGCTILDERSPPLMRAAVRWTGEGTGNRIFGCRLGRGTENVVEGGGKLTVESCG